MSSLLSPVEIVTELNRHKVILDCMAAVLRYDSAFVEVRTARTLMESWTIQFELLLEELSDHFGLLYNPLCQVASPKDGKEILEVLLHTNQVGMLELQRLSESRLR